MIKRYETSFSVNITGEDTGESFVGKFTVKTRLSHAEKMTQDQLRRSFLGAQPAGVMPNDRASTTAEILSQLAIRVVEAPSFWTNAANGADLYDDNVILDVFNATMKAEVDAKAELKKQADEAKKELAKTESVE